MSPALDHGPAQAPLWTGKLRPLWGQLLEEIQGLQPGVWTGYRLPRGAGVCLRKIGRGAYSYECAVVRPINPHKPFTDASRNRFKAEAKVFGQTFGIMSWKKSVAVRDGYIFALFSSRGGSP